MMGLEAIRRLNAAIAVEAAERELVPYVPDAEEVNYWPPIPFPDLGHFEPDGWKRTDQTWLVDNTGHGFGSEPALTAHQFKRELRAFIVENPGHGFGIVREGEFQVVVAAFRQINGKLWRLGGASNLV